MQPDRFSLGDLGLTLFLVWVSSLYCSYLASPSVKQTSSNPWKFPFSVVVLLSGFPFSLCPHKFGVKGSLWGSCGGWSLGLPCNQKQPQGWVVRFFPVLNIKLQDKRHFSKGYICAGTYAHTPSSTGSEAAEKSAVASTASSLVLHPSAHSSASDCWCGNVLLNQAFIIKLRSNTQPSLWC